MEAFSFLLSSLLLLDSDGRTENLFFASLYNVPLLYFLTIIFNALFIGTEFGDKTLHSYISAGHKRGHILFAKAFIYQVACMAMLILPLLVHGLIGVFRLETTVITMKELGIIGITVITSMLAMGMLPFFCAFLFRDLGRTLTVPIVLFFLMILGLNGKQAMELSILLPMGQLRLISLQQRMVPSFYLLGIDLLWMVILYSGAHVIFCCSDLK